MKTKDVGGKDDREVLRGHEVLIRESSDPAQKTEEKRQGPRVDGGNSGQEGPDVLDYLLVGSRDRDGSEGREEGEGDERFREFSEIKLEDSCDTMRIVALGEVTETPVKLFFETEDLDGTSRESEETFKGENGLTIKE